VGRDKSVVALEKAMEADKDIFLVTQLDPPEDDPGRDDLYDIGVVATVLQMLKLPDGTVRVLVEGRHRAVLSSIEEADGYLTAQVEAQDDIEATGNEIEAMMRSVADQFEGYAKLNKKL